MKQGETYIFDQADGSNWYHPLGMAYFPDGAHTGVDELEPGIAQTGGSTTCAAGNTCQAPMYYKNGEFAGTTYDNMAATPVGGDDFGLDVYEPDFFYPKDQWGENSYFIALTITDTAYAKDLFYFCHIHAGRAAPSGSSTPRRPPSRPPTPRRSSTRRPTTRRRRLTTSRAAPTASTRTSRAQRAPTSSCATPGRSPRARSATASRRWTAPWTRT